MCVSLAEDIQWILYLDLVHVVVVVVEVDLVIVSVEMDVNGIEKNIEYVLFFFQVVIVDVEVQVMFKNKLGR